MTRKIDHKKHGIHDLKLCRICDKGACCREGVEVDLFEVARILKRTLTIAKPWFHFIRRDKSSPSGFVFDTVVRGERCVFQAADRRCRVYNIRPRYCREFPLEDGQRAPYYHSLCHRAKRNRAKSAKRKFKHLPVGRQER
jgi:Fe-S-cluster containining protein